jgi:hypothetical protein
VASYRISSAYVAAPDPSSPSESVYSITTSTPRSSASADASSVDDNASAKIAGAPVDSISAARRSSSAGEASASVEVPGSTLPTISNPKWSAK